jgi:hypothetical protein
MMCPCNAPDSHVWQGCQGITSPGVRGTAHLAGQWSLQSGTMPTNRRDVGGVAPSLSGRWRSGLEGNLSQARQKASEVVDVVRDGTEHLIERTRDVIDEQMTRLDEAIEAAQKAAAEQAAAYRQRSGEQQESG